MKHDDVRTTSTLHQTYPSHTSLITADRGFFCRDTTKQHLVTHDADAAESNTPAAQLPCFSVRQPNPCFSNDMLLWDRGSTTIPAGWKPCLLGRGNPTARRHFVNNVALGAQSPLTEIKARLLPCLPLSYPAISGQPCGYPVKMSSGSVVDPVDGLSLVAAKRVNESEASAGNVRANGKFS